MSKANRPLDPSLTAAITNPPLGQWVFFDWVPARHIRMDSGNDPGHYPNIGAQTASPARGMGQSLLGTYNFENPLPNSHFETLDPCENSIELKSGIQLITISLLC